MSDSTRKCGERVCGPCFSQVPQRVLFLVAEGVRPRENAPSVALADFVASIQTALSEP